MKKFTIAVDFDGTIVEHAYPEIGEEIPGAITTIKALQAAGHAVFLWTARPGIKRIEAEEWLGKRGVELDAPTYYGPDCTKALADIYIDDRAIGCPMGQAGSKGEFRPYVDWQAISEYFVRMGALKNASFD